MKTIHTLSRQFQVRRHFGIELIALVVALHGLFIIATTLLAQLAVRHASHLSDLLVDVPLIIGLGLIYLSTLLRRRKYTAWIVTIAAYALYLGINIESIFTESGLHHSRGLVIARSIVLPVAVVVLLWSLRRQYVVRSDTQGFRTALRFSLLVLVVAFVYGIMGFQLLDKTDFHQEISFSGAIHHTLDQFDLTTSQPLQPYTKRAHLFVDSLSFVSITAIAYAALSLFQPLRARFSDQTFNRQHMAELLKQYKAPSEDYFKLWPHDKQYFFDQSGSSGLAFHVYRGVAICLADPVGKFDSYERLLEEFQDVCHSNDWLPGLIHVESKYRELYEAHGFSMQKIGQEAVLDIAKFQADVADNKYFRQIQNRFNKQHFSTELLQPPHHQAVLDRLRTVSDEWLSRGGRVERGFVMGYFNDHYLQQCAVMVVRDAAGTIQAFLNLVPADFDEVEATYDMLRHTTSSASNTNDFLLMQTIEQLAVLNYQRLNLGLCPLVGMDEGAEDRKTILDSVLRFAYANGDRFYSFSGLHRFKAKYEPEWQDRYIAYQGGLRGFSRTMNGLMRVMRVKKSQLRHQ